MKCDVSIELLNGYLDGELDEQEQKRLDAHIATCPCCQHELAELRALDARIRESEVQGPSREFIFRVNRSVMDKIRGQRRLMIFKLAPVFVPVAVAALVLIVMVNAPQPERLINLDDQVLYREVEVSSVSDKKDLDLQLPDLPERKADDFYRDVPASGFAAKKEAAPPMPSEPVMSKSGERTVSIEEGLGAEDRCEKAANAGLIDELEIPSHQIVRAIVDTSGNIVKVATGNTLIPETDTVLENCLKGRQVQVPMVGGRRTQMYIDFTQEKEDLDTQ